MRRKYKQMQPKYIMRNHLQLSLRPASFDNTVIQFQNDELGQKFNFDLEAD